MDEYGNIEHNRQALVRILATLVAMAGTSVTLPRRLRNAVLRLLRPAESAARRLVIALAQGLVVTLAPQRVRKPVPVRRRRHFEPKMPPEPKAPKAPVRIALPLLDAPRRFGVRHAPVRNSVPRISFHGERRPIPPSPTPFDLLDTTRLKLRLDALARVLGDLPRQAERFARWRARQVFLRAKGNKIFRRPLRFGRPPGTTRRPRHEVDDVLAFSHQLALEALHDTS